MKRMHRAATHFVGRCLPGTRLSRQTGRLEPGIREALAEDLHVPTDDLDEIATQIEQAKQALHESQQKETFLGQRYCKYRRLQDQKAEQLAEEQKHHRDDEADPDLEGRLEAWEKDEDALQSILVKHKEIMAHCETLRRRIRDLEHRQLQIQGEASELQAFVKDTLQEREERRREHGIPLSAVDTPEVEP